MDFLSSPLFLHPDHLCGWSIIITIYIIITFDIVRKSKCLTKRNANRDQADDDPKESKGRCNDDQDGHRAKVERLDGFPEEVN